MMDKIYFLFVNDQQIGPFSLDELKAKHINPETYVWYEGLDDWTQVRNIEGLKSLFSSIPPQFNKNTKENISQKSHDKILGMKKLRFYALVFSICLLSILLYFRSTYIRQQDLIYSKSRQIEQMTTQNHNQQKMIEELQVELTENIENNRRLFDSEVRDNIENKRQTLLIQLNEAQANLRKAEAELSDAESFQLLRMSWEREEDIRVAMDNVDKWRLEIIRLEQSMKSLTKTGY